MCQGGPCRGMKDFLWMFFLGHGTWQMTVTETTGGGVEMGPFWLYWSPTGCPVQTGEFGVNHLFCWPVWLSVEFCFCLVLRALYQDEMLKVRKDSISCCYTRFKMCFLMWKVLSFVLYSFVYWVSVHGKGQTDVHLCSQVFKMHIYKANQGKTHSNQRHNEKMYIIRCVTLFFMLWEQCAKMQKIINLMLRLWKQDTQALSWDPCSTTRTDPAPLHKREMCKVIMSMGHRSIFLEVWSVVIAHCKGQWGFWLRGHINIVFTLFFITFTLLLFGEIILLMSSSVPSLYWHRHF